MAYVEKYSCTFVDRLDTEWIVYLRQEGAGAGSTALTPAAEPLLISWGEPGRDPLGVLLSSYAELRFVDTVDTVIAAIFGGGLDEWQMLIEKDGVEVWSGGVETDFGDRPVGHVNTYSVFATCGLSRLKNYKFTSTGRMPIIEAVADCLNAIPQSAYVIWALSNWHAYNAGSASDGDSLGRYRIDASETLNEDGTYRTCEEVLVNLLGILQCRVMMGEGAWFVVQRDQPTGLYTATKYDAAGADLSTTAFVTALTVGAGATLRPGTMLRGLLAYGETSYRYEHGTLGRETFWNASFEDFGAGAFSFWSKTGSYTLQQVTGQRIGPPPQGRKAAYIPARIPSGDWELEFQYGLYQTGSNVPGGSPYETYFTFQAALAYTSDPVDTNDHVFAWEYKIIGGTTYWWNNDLLIWQTSQYKNVESLKYNWRDNVITVRTTTNPVSGSAFIQFWNAVELGTNTGKLGGVVIDNFIFDIIGDDDTAAEETTTTLVEAGTGNVERAGTERYIFGSGPTANHERRLTYLLTAVETTANGWKDSAYAADATTGYTLAELWVRQKTRQRHTARLRFMGDLLLSALGLWGAGPHKMVIFDSVVYSPDYIAYEVRGASLRLEGSEVELGTLISETVTETYDFAPLSAAPNQIALRTGLASPTLGEALVYNGENWVNSGAAERLLYSATADKTIADATEATLLSATAEGTATLPADLLAAGTRLVVEAAGVYTDDATAAGLVFRLKLGAATLLTTPSYVPDNVTSNLAWRARFTVTCRTAGATGTVIAEGAVEVEDGAAAATLILEANTSTTTVDTEAALAVDLTADWSKASQTITATTATIKTAKP